MSHPLSHSSRIVVATSAFLAIAAFVESSHAQFRRSGGQSGGDSERIKDFYTKLDVNKNGQIEPEEYNKNFMRRTIERRFREAGMDPKKPIPLKQFFDKRLQGSASGSSTASSRTGSRPSSRARAKTSDRVAMSHERLPKDVPQWFREKDVNLNGQIEMSEFHSEWNDDKAAEFMRIDLNRDFVITPKEVVAFAKGDTGTPRFASRDRSSASKSIAARDEDKKQPSESNERKGSADPKSDQSNSAPSNSTEAEATKPPATATKTDASTIDSRTMSYAEGVVAKYDADKDGKLTPGEWSKFSKSADSDGDGAITALEYAVSLSR